VRVKAAHAARGPLSYCYLPPPPVSRLSRSRLRAAWIDVGQVLG